MAALRSLEPDTVDWLRVSRWDRFCGAVREFERGLGTPPAPVIAATVAGWGVIAYAVIEAAT